MHGEYGVGAHLVEDDLSVPVLEEGLVFLICSDIGLGSEPEKQMVGEPACLTAAGVPDAEPVGFVSEHCLYGFQYVWTVGQGEYHLCLSLWLPGPDVCPVQSVSEDAFHYIIDTDAVPVRSEIDVIDVQVFPGTVALDSDITFQSFYNKNTIKNISRI